MTTKILACKCKHNYQDSVYGHGMRVHNWARKARGSGSWRCSVCKDEKQVAAEVKVKQPSKSQA